VVWGLKEVKDMNDSMAAENEAKETSFPKFESRQLEGLSDVF